MPKNPKPLASISMDLDNLWSYMKTHGDSGWETFPSYFDILIPYVLELFESLNLEITFFIVGQDAALEKNQTALKIITNRGHEVANHSFHHEPWLQLYSKDKIRWEVLETEEHIVRVTGRKSIGFRGPGFSWSSELFETLVENDYLYDASTLPTYMGPLARLYYFWTSELTNEEKEKRGSLYGTFKDGLRPVKAYNWQLAMGEKLLEIPVTTAPVIKTPFHLSYLLYISRFSQATMSFYLKMALFLCKMTGTEPSFLLHPLDFLGGDQVPELKFFPGMDLSGTRKRQIFEKVIKTLSKYFEFVNMGTHAKSLLKRKNLEVVKI